MPESIQQYLITGANGQLGMELVRQLGEESVIAKPRETFNVSDMTKVKELIPLLRPAAVIHTAAMTDWVTAEQKRDECWRTNLQGTDNLVKVCALHGIPFVHISCDSVFGANRDPRPRTETDPVVPCHQLAVTKACAEHAVLRLGQCVCPEFWQKGFRYWVIRTGLLYERPWRQNQNLVSRILRQADNRRGEEVSLASDMIFTPTYAPHLAKALVWLVRHYREMPSGVYHVGNLGHCSAYQFGQEISSNSRRPLKIRSTTREQMSQAFGGWDARLLPYHTALDCSKFADVVPIPLPDWREGVEQFSLDYES